MSKELNVIGIAVESIKNDNLNELDNALRIMPIEKLKDPAQNLFVTFLSLCAGYNRPQALSMVLDRWKVVYPDNDVLPIMTRLFLIVTLNNSALAYIVLSNPEYTYVELMDDLINFDSSQEVSVACARAEKIFGQQSHHTYKILRNNAREIGNYVVEEYMVDKISETAPFAPIPEYIKNHLANYYPQYKDKLPTESELDQLAEKQSETVENITLPSDDEAVEMLTEGLSRYGISIEEIDDAKEIIREEISDPKKKKELLLPLLKNQNEQSLDSDRVLFWIYGPSNPLLDQDLTIDAPSYNFGGARLQLCDLFDYDEEYDYVVEWFTGSCKQCLMRIREKWHAVRKPRSMGGWEHCYCSWKCVKEDFEERENFEEEEDLLTERIIEAFEKKTKEVGIQDRTK